MRLSKVNDWWTSTVYPQPSAPVQLGFQLTNLQAIASSITVTPMAISQVTGPLAVSWVRRKEKWILLGLGLAATQLSIQIESSVADRGMGGQ